MIIRISDSSLTTTLGIGATVASNNNCFDEYSTTVCCLTSTLSTSPVDDAHMHYHSSTHYINSLSNEQIIMLEKKIAEKNEEIVKIGDKEYTMSQVAEITTPIDTQQDVGIKTYEYKKI